MIIFHYLHYLEIKYNEKYSYIFIIHIIYYITVLILINKELINGVILMVITYFSINLILKITIFYVL